MQRITKLTGLLAAFVIAALVFGTIGIANAQLSGAIFTTDSSGQVVNQNIYNLRADVYLNGGPQNQNPAGLPTGTYYFQVTDPSGNTLLSTDNAVCRQVVVAANANNIGVVAGAAQASVDAGCAHAAGTFNPANGSTPVQLAPFDFTPNNGSEYKVWLIGQTTGTSISTDYPKVIIFNNSDSKTDNFKVLETECVECLTQSTISGTKFYDANLNGVLDVGEAGVPFWKIWIYSGPAGFTPEYDTTSVLVPIGGYDFINLALGSYNVCEVLPLNAPAWVPTGPTSITGIGVPPDSINNNFGNVCLGAGGGRTLGFWSNKNGQLVMNDGGTMAPELALLTSLHLVDANGSPFDPANYNSFRNWLLSATATNMAYMLSAQLAAMELNLEAGFVGGSAAVYAPGCGDPYLNSTGNFITITNLMAAADAQLAAHPLTTEASDPTNRAAQECLKNAIDGANNNRNFVQMTPCDVNYSGDEASCVPQQ